MGLRFALSRVWGEVREGWEGFFSQRRTENSQKYPNYPVQTNPHSANRSAKSGAQPSAPPRACIAVGNATNELAKDRAQDTESNRDHRLRHANAAEWNMVCGASRALATAKLSMNWRASSLHLPPVSRATTTRRHLSHRKSSTYFLSFSSRAREHTAPSNLAAPSCAVPSAVRAHLSVISTVSWAPKNNGSLTRGLQRPCRPEPSPPRSCHVVWRCTSQLHQPLGTPWPESSLVPGPQS